MSQLLLCVSVVFVSLANIDSVKPDLVFNSDLTAQTPIVVVDKTKSEMPTAFVETVIVTGLAFAFAFSVVNYMKKQ